MICAECGASRPIRRSIWSRARKLIGRVNLFARARRRSRQSRDQTAPSLTELVALVERDAGMTIFG
jgi:hypothetical protein